MEEPTKADIDTIFKRLKTIPANKVCQNYFVILYVSIRKYVNRCVSTVILRILHGRQLHTVYFCVLIVRPDIVA